jgi:vacuolar-type H+-ATPase subunit I/STV1
VKRGKWWNPLWRSQPMNYITITMGNETAGEVVRELGVFGKFHIEDVCDTHTNQMWMRYENIDIVTVFVPHDSVIVGT